MICRICAFWKDLIELWPTLQTTIKTETETKSQQVSCFGIWYQNPPQSLDFRASTHSMLQPFSSFAWSICYVYALGTPMPVCLRLQDREGLLLQCGCKQGGCVLYAQEQHKMIFVSSGKFGCHYFLEDAIALDTNITCVEQNDNMAYVPCPRHADWGKMRDAEAKVSWSAWTQVLDFSFVYQSLLFKFSTEDPGTCVENKKQNILTEKYRAKMVANGCFHARKGFQSLIKCCQTKTIVICHWLCEDCQQQWEVCSAKEGKDLKGFGKRCGTVDIVLLCLWCVKILLLLISLQFYVLTILCILMHGPIFFPCSACWKGVTRSTILSICLLFVCEYDAVVTNSSICTCDFWGTQFLCLNDSIRWNLSVGTWNF